MTSLCNPQISRLDQDRKATNDGTVNGKSDIYLHLCALCTLKTEFSQQLLWVIFALLQDSEYEYGSGAGSTDPIESGSNSDPDP